MRVSDEQIEFIGPEPVDFGLELTKSARADAIDPLPAGLFGLDEAHVGKEQQVLRNRGTRDVELCGNIRHRPRLLGQQLEDAAPSGLGSSGEGVDHK